MKRLFAAIVLFFVTGISTAPIGAVTITKAEIKVSQNMAVAANCVKIALPIAGTDKCLENDEKNGGVLVSYTKDLIKFVAGLIGGVIVLMLTIAGFQYILSRGDAAAIKSAKDRIQNSIIALILFLSSVAILNYLLPSGF